MAWRNTALEQMDMSGLAVSFEPTSSVHGIRIALTCSGKPEFGSAPGDLEKLAFYVNGGFAGGSSFAPKIGSARLVKGPRSADPDDLTIATAYDFELEMGGVDRLFIAIAVESLASSGNPHKVTSLTIAPTEGMSDSPQAVNEEDVKRWLQDNTEFPGRWPEIPFEILEQSKARGGTVQVRLASEPSSAAFDDLAMVIRIWRALLGLFPEPELKMQGMADFEPRLARKKQELTAHFRVFDYHPKAASDALINALCRFHHNVATIERVTLALS